MQTKRVTDVSTERAIRSIALAQHEPGAQNCMGNILVGLIEEKTGIAAKQLKRMRIDVSTVRRVTRELDSARLSLQEFAAFLEGAHGQATALGHNFVGTEHLLLALLADSRAQQLLTKSGIDSGATRAELLRMLGFGN